MSLVVTSTPFGLRSSFSNKTAANGVTGKSALLQRIKYFEQKTNQIHEERRRSITNLDLTTGPPGRKLSIKNTINNARDRFLTGKDSQLLNQESYVPLRRASPSSGCDSEDSASESGKRLSVKSTTSSTKENDVKLFNGERPTTLNSGYNEAPYILTSKPEDLTAKPVRKLSIKSTIYNARQRFQTGSYSQLRNKENVIPVSQTSSKSNSEDSKSKTAKEHFPKEDNNQNPSNKIYLNETPIEKPFKIILKGYFYQNMFYSLEHFDQVTYYLLDDLLDDYFDYDIYESELFDYYST